MYTNRTSDFNTYLKSILTRLYNLYSYSSTELTNIQPKKYPKEKVPNPKLNRNESRDNNILD